MTNKNRDLNGSAETSGEVASGEDSVSDGQKFGPWLRSQRELREIDLRDIAEASKISVRYLEAMESGRFDVLPAAVFTKGFLRQYARYVGLDPEEVVSFYLAAQQALDEESDEPEELRTYRPPQPPKPSGMRYVVLALLLAAVLLGIVWGLSIWRKGSARAPDAEVETQTPATTSATRTSPDSDAGEGSGSGEGSGAGEGRGSGEDALGGASALADDGSVTGEPAPGEGSAGESADNGNVVGEPDGASDSLSGTQPAAALAGSSDRPIWLTLDFSGPCWVEARVDGRRAVSELRVQGESLRLEADSRVELRLGDVTAVRMEVNGMPYDPGVGPGGNVVRVLTIDLETVGQLRANAVGLGTSDSSTAEDSTSADPSAANPSASNF